MFLFVHASHQHFHSGPQWKDVKTDELGGAFILMGRGSEKRDTVGYRGFRRVMHRTKLCNSA